MNDSRPEQKSPWRPMTIGLVLIAVVPLLWFGGFLTLFFARQSAAAHDVAQRMEDLRSRGAPVDDVSLREFHRSMTSDQDTLRWVTAGEPLQSDAFSESRPGIPYFDPSCSDPRTRPTTVPSPGMPWPNRADVEAFLKQWEIPRSEIHELAAAQLEPDTAPLRRPITFNSFMTQLPDTDLARVLARLMALEHDLAVHDRDGDRAFACIQSARGVQRSFAGEPLLVSQQVAIAIGDRTNEMLRRSIEHDLFSDDQLATINDNLPTFEQLVANYRVAVQGERALALPLFLDPARAQEAFARGNRKVSGVQASNRVRSRDAVLYLELMEAFERIPAISMDVFRDRGKQIQSDLQADLEDDSAVERFEKLFTTLMLPALGYTTGEIVRAEESNRLARTAIAVRLFQRCFDRWPSTLGELSEIDVDVATLMPGGDRPFGYVADGADVIVWGTDRSRLSEIPREPHRIQYEEDPQQRWVWRLRAKR